MIANPNCCSAKIYAAICSSVKIKLEEWGGKRKRERKRGEGGETDQEQPHSSKAVCSHLSHLHRINHPAFPAAVLQPSVPAMLMPGLTSRGGTHRVWLIEIHPFHSS